VPRSFDGLGGAPKPPFEARALPLSTDLAKLGSSELVKLHTHPNEWFARQARLELVARVEAGRGLGAANAQLRELFEKQGDPVVKLRAFWSLYAIGAADEAFLRAQLRHPNEHVRAWAIRLLTDTWPLDTVMSERPGGRPEAALDLLPDLSRLAREDASGLVRLVLASTLQRLAVARRAELASALVSRRED